MDEAAQDVGSSEPVGVDAADDEGRHLVGLGQSALAKGPVGTVRVVALDVLTEHRCQVATSEHEHPVQALAPDRADESLGGGVDPWRPDRRLDDPDALGGEDVSKDSVNLVSRSRTRNLALVACSASSIQRFRGC